MDDIATGFPGRVSVWGRHLGSGEGVALHPGRIVATGSAAKVLVLVTYAEQVARGILDPTRRVEVHEEDMRLGSGVLRLCAPGLQPTLEDLAYLMVAVSDNVATDLLLAAVGGRGVVNDLVRSLGVGDAEVASDTVWVIPPKQFGLASPRGLASVYSVLAAPEAAGYPPEAAERCLAVLARHAQLNGFARHLAYSPYAGDVGMASPLMIWSKGGSYPSVQCEAGLFEAGSSRWVLAVMCDEVTDWRAGAAGAASTLIADVARQVHDGWARPGR